MEAARSYESGISDLSKLGKCQIFEPDHSKYVLNNFNRVNELSLADTYKTGTSTSCRFIRANYASKEEFVPAVCWKSRSGRLHWWQVEKNTDLAVSIWIFICLPLWLVVGRCNVLYITGFVLSTCTVVIVLNGGRFNRMVTNVVLVLNSLFHIIFCFVALYRFENLYSNWELSAAAVGHLVTSLFLILKMWELFQI